jgi:hypothetical protein
MTEVPSKLEAVRLAKETLGDVPPQDLAAFVQAQFGVTLNPVIVTVLLASLREREYLEQSKRRVLEAAQAASDRGTTG